MAWTISKQYSDRFGQLVAALPKAELKLDLAHSIDPAFALERAHHNRVRLPFSSVGEWNQTIESGDSEAIDRQIQATMGALRNEVDFYDLASRALDIAGQSNIRYVNLTFEPQIHARLGVPFEVIGRGVLRAVSAAKGRAGPIPRAQINLRTDADEESGFETLAALAEFLGNVHGIGLKSIPGGNPPSEYSRVFAAARAIGLRISSYCSLSDPYDFVDEALDALAVARVDNNLLFLDQDHVCERMSAAQIGVLVSPVLLLGAQRFEHAHDIPLHDLLARNLVTCLSGDSAQLWNYSLNDSFLLCGDAHDLSAGELAQLAKNSFLMSTLPIPVVARFLDQIDKIHVEFAEGRLHMAQ